MKSVTKIAALACALVLSLALVACGGSGSGSASASASSASASASGSSAAAAELVGKPWVTSILQGNLPAEQPAAKDDLYTHYNYEYLLAHQELPSTNMMQYANELQTVNLGVIANESESNHDLDQLRIFFEQASDAEGLQKAGLTELQPYLDRIDAVTSIEEMNALLASDDFPFSPFVVASITVDDTRDVNIVAVYPNLALVDPLFVGGAYYQDSDDLQVQASMRIALQNSSVLPLLDLMGTGMESSKVQEMFPVMADFEKAYGKYSDYSGKYVTRDFGAMAEAARGFKMSLDELCAACPNFPMRAVLGRLGKGASPRYVADRAWVEALNGVWTNENIEVIKLIAKMKVLSETRPYRDPTFINTKLAEFGQPVADATTFAYEACNQQDTFAILLAETYANEALGPNAKARLSELAQNLIGTYKGLVDTTPWLSEGAQQSVIEKLDHMTLNILEPVGGYYDFSGLELTPTDEGGTLLGNYLKLRQYRLDQESKMVGAPAVAASTWFTIRPTEINAFYDAQSNSINIYPGYATSLIYRDDMSDLDLLATAGFAIGHEISHGFDYQGAQFDAYGTPNPVFADTDANAFVLKSSTLAMYYNGMELASGYTVNGASVVTEAAADLCGMQVVLELAGKTENPDYDKFFASMSNVWAQVVPQTALPSLVLDAHPAANYRINVNAQMFDPIYDKLGVAKGDGMYLAPEKRINIWGPNA